MATGKLPRCRSLGCDVNHAPKPDSIEDDRRFGLGPILLQKSKVAGPRIFRENTKRKTVTDSYDLNRIAEVACEFNARR
jgi:hypothetical protein